MLFYYSLVSDDSFVSDSFRQMSLRPGDSLERPRIENEESRTKEPEQREEEERAGGEATAAQLGVVVVGWRILDGCVGVEGGGV